MAAKADLHIHSTASDGRMTPEEIVATACDLNLAVIALTDHDTIDGVEAAMQAARRYDLEVMNGVEITAAFEDREVHMLAYDFDIQNKKLNLYLRDHQKARIERATSIVKHLQDQGLELDIDEVLAEAQLRNVGRPHIAAVLVAKGYVASFKEAFIRYLNDEVLSIIKNYYHSIDDIIAAVKQAGGVIIVAHPGRLYDNRQLKQFVEFEIDGLETAHPSHSYKVQKKLEHFAEVHNLLITGGSDFHGKKKKNYRYFGTLGVSMKRVESIKRLAEHRKQVTA